MMTLARRAEIMKNITIVSIAIAMACLFSGCTPTNSSSSLKSKAARMSPDLLRSQVLRYKALVEKDAEEFHKEVFKDFAPIDPPYTPEVTASINTAMAEYVETHRKQHPFSENFCNYYFFYEKLKEKGGDMTGLELEIDYDYEKYISPPIKEPPSPHSEPKTTEPA